VGSGGDALEAAAGRTWDMLLLDCETPGMDGCRTAAQIRRLAAPVSSVPIIAMTVASHPFAGRLRSAGIDDYLAKPVRLSDLAAALERWVPALLPGAIESA
jgi:CheY-like chemotaxis protein